MSSVVTEPQRRTAGSPEIPATLAPRKARPVVWWAAVGGVAGALQAWIYGSWLTSDDFRTVTIGRSQVPGYHRMWAWILQTVFSAVALAAIGFVVRTCVKQRRLSLEAKIMLAWWAVIW